MDRKSMILGIAGSRELTTHNTKFVKKTLEKFFSEKSISKIIHGGARGVDTIAHSLGCKLKYKIEVIRPLDPSVKWHYIARNKKIVDKADLMLIFWDGKSPGSQSVITYCKAIGKSYTLFLIPRA